MREFLKGLDLDKETIDTIMAEHGKLITEEKEKNQELTNKVKDYESKISDLSSKAEANTKVQEELETLKNEIAEKEAKRKAEEQDKILTNNILELFGDKKFTSDYAKNGLLNDIKNGLNLPENKGKGIQELFDSLTKDRTGIFENENKIQDMAPMESVENVSELKGGLDIKLNPMFKNYN